MSRECNIGVLPPTFLEAVVSFDLPLALFALDVAAPVELAVTALQHLLHLAMEASTATEGVATFLGGGTVAGATPCPGLLAEIRARLYVYQVGVRVVAQCRPHRDEPPASWPHLCRPVEAVPQ